jgi:hypothetical protein
VQCDDDWSQFQGVTQDMMLASDANFEHGASRRSCRAVQAVVAGLTTFWLLMVYIVWQVF